MLNIGSLNTMFRSLKQIRTSLKQRPHSVKALLQKGLKRFFCIALCSLVWLTGHIGNAYAAESIAETMTPDSSAMVAPALAADTDIAAEKIDQFAQAYLQVLELLSDREAEISAAQTNEEALNIEKSIEKDAVTIIQASGLSMPEYMQILELASQDTAFQDKIVGRMDETGNATP